MEQRRRFVLDMDVGIDDALAIILLARQPGVEIVAVGSVHGNIDALTAALNALRALEVCGLGEVPVAVGAERPLVRPLELATHVHGDDGLGNTDMSPPSGQPTGESAAEQLLRLAHNHPGELELLAVGPLTNLALALRRDPLVLTRFRSTTIMGGAGPQQPPNALRVGYDANTDHDAEAAEMVYAAPGRRTLVGLNVTMPCVLAGDDLARTERCTSPHGRFVCQILQHYLDVYEKRLGYRGCSLHDPLAAGVALDPSLVTAALAGPVVVVDSPRGRRAVLSSPAASVPRPPSHVVTVVDTARFLEVLVAAVGG